MIQFQHNIYFKGNKMKIKEKLNLDIEGIIEHGAINIVAFGDSVTHGAIEGYDYENVYWNLLRKKLNAVRDIVPVNVINSGIAGITSRRSLSRIQRDVISHHPDLVIVCFGLNDSNLESYINSMTTIFKECLDAGAEVIYLTPNMLNTYVDPETASAHMDYAKVTAARQMDGSMDNQIYSAIEVAKEMGVKVCDCYSEWKKLYESGVDTTQLLINKINHPTAEMHKLFADMLFDVIMNDETNTVTD